MLSKLGKYEIKRELGRGAMGIVYEGFDPFIERIVAIKTIKKNLIDKSETEDTLSRFRREAQAAGRLTHPNIVSVYEYDEDKDVAFIAMEYVVGIELKEHFDKTVQFTISDCTRIMTQLLDALEYSHVRGVVHRDIKPANILITKEGQVKIADFGIARIESSDLTQVGTVLGTPSYMSPEQFMGLEADRRSDVYSAGIILYQFLTGVRPFTGSNTTVIMYKVLNEAPENPGILNPDLPKALIKVMEKAIAKRPEDRYQTAADFKGSLILASEPRVASHAPSEDSEVTIKIAKPAQNPQKIDIGQTSAVDFSVDDFDARLKEAQQEANRRPVATFMEEGVASLSEVKLNFDHFTPSEKIEGRAADSTPTPTPTIVPTFHAESSGSNLLEGLALEAKEKQGAKQGAKQSKLQESQGQAKRVDDALNRIVKFFYPLIRHANEVEPAINRTYRYDTHTVYSNLKWKNANVDYRKQSLSDAALLEYVTFTVNLCAQEPILLKRPLG
ncbi:MAG: serine/threonine protein kinase, partial [Gallionella sp.]|nr:serine/threonine protein kinase [Gallionella sp.]